MKIRCQAAGMTDVGRMRTENEDSLLIDDGIGLYAVADGMGGHVEALLEAWSDGSAKDVDDVMHTGFSRANDRIREEVQRKAEWQGMGTTLVAARVQNSTAIVANVGDSRTYLVRDGSIQQLTIDHSWVMEQVDSGRLSPEAAATHPYRNVITRALGSRSEVEVDLFKIRLQAGDRLLLCSDGLTGMLDDEEILDFIHQEEHPEDAVHALVEAANEAGGEDNITAILISFEEEG
jgi:serine/threonine protein phosphatase PrpC